MGDSCVGPPHEASIGALSVGILDKIGVLSSPVIWCKDADRSTFAESQYLDISPAASPRELGDGSVRHLWP
jgi:hypothetical protein